MWYSFELFSSHRLRNFSFSSRRCVSLNRCPLQLRIASGTCIFKKQLFFTSEQVARTLKIWKARPRSIRIQFLMELSKAKPHLSVSSFQYQTKLSGGGGPRPSSKYHLGERECESHLRQGKKKIVLSIQMQRRKEKKKRWRDERELIEGEWKTGSNLTSSFFISRYLQYVKIPFKRDFNRVIPLPFKFPVYRIELFPNQYISRPINTFVPKETRFAPSKTPLKASRVSRTIDPRWKLFNTRAPFFLNYNQVRPPTMRPPREIAPHLCPRQFQFFYTF